MVRKSSNQPFPGLPRIGQLTNSHCGPAVLNMLARFNGFTIGQKRFVKAALVEAKLKHQGMNVFDLARSVKTLLPQLDFWFKDHARSSDLHKLINTNRLPVGVEWRGDFGKYADEDNGHWSIITSISLPNKLLTLADPFSQFAGRDRKYRLAKFLPMWWDENEVVDPVSLRKKIVKDIRLLFVITAKSTSLSPALQMHKV